MKIGLSYNLKEHLPTGRPSLDGAAEAEAWQTVERVAQALRSTGATVEYLPFTAEIWPTLEAKRPDLVFNIAEGWVGRNREGILPAILEHLGIPYTGSDPLTLSLSLDKVLSKQVFFGAGLATPPFRVYSSAQQVPSDPGMGYPLFVKPQAEGSSMGIRNFSRVENREELVKVVDWVVQEYSQPALVEPFLPGREFSVGFIGNGSTRRTLPILEVLPKEPEGPFVYSYQVKSQNQEIFQCPAQIPEDLARQLESLALGAIQVLGCRDLARVDLRLDDQGTPQLLEVNSLPGLSQDSLYPYMARQIGMSFDELIASILQAALDRQNSD